MSTELYPYPTANETQSLTGLANYINNVAGGNFFSLLLLGMFIISFVVTMSFGIGNAFVFATFFCSILAIFFVIAGFLNPTWMYLLFVLLAISLVLKRLGKSSTLPQI